MVVNVGRNYVGLVQMTEIFATQDSFYHVTMTLYSVYLSISIIDLAGAEG